MSNYFDSINNANNYINDRFLEVKDEFTEALKKSIAKEKAQGEGKRVQVPRVPAGKPQQGQE